MSAPAGLRRSVPEGIATVLRDRILEGELRPGAALREAALAREFDASRNTVREALVRLEHQGLVHKTAHRGCRVAHPDREEIREVMALRRVVEPGAVRLLAGTPGIDLDEPRRLAAAMEEAAAAGAWEDYGRLDLRFHAELVARAGSRRLADAFGRALRPLHLHLLAADVAAAGEGSRRHVTEHRALVDAVAAGQVDAALELLDRHLADAEEALFAEPAADDD